MWQDKCVAKLLGDRNGMQGRLYLYFKGLLCGDTEGKEYHTYGNNTETKMNRWKQELKNYKKKYTVQLGF